MSSVADSSFDNPLARVAAFLGCRVDSRGGVRLSCPAHGGKPGSLVLWQAAEGRLGAKCYSGGCSYSEILSALESRVGQPLNPQRLPSFSVDGPAKGCPTKAKPVGVRLQWAYTRGGGEGQEILIDAREEFDYGPCYREDCLAEGPHKHPWLDKSLLPNPDEPVDLDGWEVRFHFPEGQEDAATVILAEGGKTAEAVALAGYAGVSYIGGSGRAAAANYAKLAGKAVLISPDNDNPGNLAAWQSAYQSLKAGADQVAVADPVEGPRGADLADLDPEARRKKIAADLEKADWIGDLDQARLQLARSDLADRCRRLDPRRLISAGKNREFHKHLAQAWAEVRRALNGDPRRPELLTRMGTVVTLCSGSVKPLVPEALMEPFARAAFWHKGWDRHPLVSLRDLDAATAAAVLETAAPQAQGRVISAFLDGKGRAVKEDAGAPWLVLEFPRPAYPVSALVRAAAANPEGELPPLGNLIHFPLLTALGREGSLLTESGYSPETTAWLELPVLEKRTAAEGAVDWREFLADFSFAAEADLTAAVALALTPLVHFACGKAPLCMVHKADNRVGASLLTEVLTLIVTGRLPEDVVPEEGSLNSAEMDKLIGTLYREGAEVLRLDNIPAQLQSGLIASILTAVSPSLRVLGKSERISADGRFTSWCATGCSTRMSTELLRRCYFLTLNAEHPEPGQRAGPSTGPNAGQAWQHPDILAAALELRPRLLGGLAAMVQHWLDLKCPGPAAEVPPIGGFENWRRVVGGILRANGFRDFMAGREAFLEARDDGRGESYAFASAWWQRRQGRPSLVKDLAAIARINAGPEAEEPPLVTIYSRDNGPVGRNRAFSDWLGREMEGRTFPLEEGGLVQAGRAPVKGRKGAILYQLTPVPTKNGHSGAPPKSGGSGGSGGSF